jgi:hypothetical protein
MTSSSGLRGHRSTYLTILESADHALFKIVRYVLLRPLRPYLDAFKNNYRVRKRESESMATLATALAIFLPFFPNNIRAWPAESK